MDFGTFLEHALEYKNIKKSDFAKSLRISRQTLSSNISKWKSGREPNISTIKKYICTLNLTLEDYTSLL